MTSSFFPLPAQFLPVFPTTLPTNPSEFPSETCPLKLFAKSKRILKREHARTRTKAQKLQETQETHEKSADSDKEKRKLQQKMRNRVSAQQSRDRKKAYISSLEQQTSDLLQENALLRQDLQAFAEENQRLRDEIATLRGNAPEFEAEVAETPANREETPLTDQFFLEETTNFSNNSGLSSPFRGGSRDVLKYSLALLSVVCFVAFSAGNFHSVGDFAQKPRDFPAIARVPTENLLFLPSFELLSRVRAEIMREIVKSTDFATKPAESRAIMAYRGPDFQANAGFLAKSNETQLALPAKARDFPVSTLFCPSGYVYEPQDFQAEARVFQGINQEWVHLLIPKNNMSQFFFAEDELVIKNVKTDGFLLENDGFGDVRWNSLLELWCKVSGIREIPL